MLISKDSEGATDPEPGLAVGAEMENIKEQPDSSTAQETLPITDEPQTEQTQQQTTIKEEYTAESTEITDINTETTDTQIKEPKQYKKLSGYKKPILLGMGSAILVFMVGGYSFLTLFHGSLNHIYAGSIPIRADYSDKQLEQSIKKASDSYQIIVIYPDKTQKIFKLSDTGISVDTPKTISDVKKGIRKSLVARLAWWKPLKLSLTTTTNNESLSKFITNNTTQTTTPPQNATLTISDGNTVITPEIEGSGNAVENARSLITVSASYLNPTALELKPSKLRPAITSKDLVSSEAKVKSILAQKVIFSIERRQIEATPTDIANWIEITPVESDKTVDVTINSGKIVQYIDKIAKPYIQPARSKLVSRASGSYVVLDQGRDGTDVVDKDKTAADISQQILDAKGPTTALAVKYSAAKTVEVEAYDKYLIVDVTSKRMYAYEKTNLVRTFLVSAGAPKTPTVLGQYKIFSKVAKQDMRGSNADGSRYLQPDVQYVNYFYKDYAIHGNYWRPVSYFGRVNSSHGCVGIVNDDAAWIYDWAPIGTPVITHD